jgi:hypothetical protein
MGGVGDRLAETPGIVGSAAMRNEHPLCSQVEDLHHRLGFVVPEHTDNGDRVSRMTTHHEEVDRRGIGGTMFAVEQYKIETGEPEQFTQTGSGEPDRTAVDHTSLSQNLLGRVGANHGGLSGHRGV